jgi:hypothetical protein
MGGIVFLGSLAGGAAALGFWLDWRLGKKRPASAVRRFVHAAVAFGILQVAAGVAGHWANDASDHVRFLTIFGLLLPSLVYAFLASAWLVRTLVEASPLARR